MKNVVTYSHRILRNRRFVVANVLFPVHWAWYVLFVPSFHEIPGSVLAECGPLELPTAIMIYDTTDHIVPFEGIQIGRTVAVLANLEANVSGVQLHYLTNETYKNFASASPDKEFPLIEDF